MIGHRSQTVSASQRVGECVGRETKSNPHDVVRVQKLAAGGGMRGP